jgi:hypothetical protein
LAAAQLDHLAGVAGAAEYALQHLPANTIQAE